MGAFDERALIPWRGDVPASSGGVAFANTAAKRRSLTAPWPLLRGLCRKGEVSSGILPLLCRVSCDLPLGDAWRWATRGDAANEGFAEMAEIAERALR